MSYGFTNIDTAFLGKEQTGQTGSDMVAKHIRTFQDFPGAFRKDKSDFLHDLNGKKEKIWKKIRRGGEAGVKGAKQFPGVGLYDIIPSNIHIPYLGHLLYAREVCGGFHVCCSSHRNNRKEKRGVSLTFPRRQLMVIAVLVIRFYHVKKKKAFPAFLHV